MVSVGRCRDGVGGVAARFGLGGIVGGLSGRKRRSAWSGVKGTRAADDRFRSRRGQNLAAVGGHLGPSGRSFGYVAERWSKASADG
jgi:hypothetical protein